MLKRLSMVAAILVAASAPAYPQAGQFPPGYVQGNAGILAAPSSPQPLTAMIDRAFGSTRGSILKRGASAWQILLPGTSGLPLVSAGPGADPAYSVIGPNALPAPTGSTLGGVQSLSCSSHNWFNTLSTSGVFGCAQPNFTDLAGTIAIAQLPLGTNSTVGALKCDGTTTSCSGGVVSVFGASVRTSQIATRSFVPNTIGTTTQCMARSYHIAKDAMSSIKLAWAGWSVLTSSSTPSGSGTESSPANNLTIAASVEYPAGTFTQVLFSSSSTGALTAGSTLFSDNLTVSIPSGASFWVRTWLVSLGSTGNLMPYLSTGTSNSPIYPSGGEALNCGGGATNQTMGGTVTGNQSNANIYPVAIVGSTAIPCYFIAGDSLGIGIGDGPDQSGDVGMIARLFGGKASWINASVQGDMANQAKSNYAKRGALIQYCTNAISQYGVNDVFVNNSTQTQLQTDLSAMWGVLSSGGASKVYQTTITPRTTSTDTWQTIANQSQVSAGQNTIRANVNNTIRGVPSPLWSYIEIANQIEFLNGIGLWAVPGSAQSYTADGTHPDNYGVMKIVTPAGATIH